MCSPLFSFFAVVGVGVVVHIYLYSLECWDLLGGKCRRCYYYRLAPSYYIVKGGCSCSVRKRNSRSRSRASMPSSLPSTRYDTPYISSSFNFLSVKQISRNKCALNYFGWLNFIKKTWSGMWCCYYVCILGRWVGHISLSIYFCIYVQRMVHTESTRKWNRRQIKMDAGAWRANWIWCRLVGGCLSGWVRSIYMDIRMRRWVGGSNVLLVGYWGETFVLMKLVNIIVWESFTKVFSTYRINWQWPHVWMCAVYR